ncbi:MAG: Mur ligase family protein [bacterium]
MKQILQLLLKYSSKLILAKYKPDVIGITGSVGKTSAKEAIAAVLSYRFKIRANSKNYNNEIGLPLTIIGAESAGKSLFGWLLVFLKILNLLIFKSNNYPEILILEMGVDRPGDMDYLNSIVKPKVGIITLIGSSHMEFFKSQEEIMKEKKKIFNNLQPGGWAILNYDDNFTSNIRESIKHKVLTFGFDENADLTAQNIICSFQQSDNINSLAGINFKLKYEGAYIPILLPRVISYASIYAAIAGAAAGFIYKMNGIEIADSLKQFNLPKGRMNLIKGINNSMIIDDTYNSSPQSSIAALEIIDQINLDIIKTKYIVMGDMLELGKDSEAEHIKIGKKIASIPKAKLLVIGSEAKNIAKGAKQMNDIKIFDNQKELIKYLQDNIKAGDLILIKASQGMRLEKIVKSIMAEPEKAKDLLVRQDKGWL